MKVKENVLTKISETGNRDGYQPGREHLELLSRSKALASFEKSESKKSRGSLDSLLVKLYMAL
jgi:hypothetical protein